MSILTTTVDHLGTCDLVRVEVTEERWERGVRSVESTIVYDVWCSACEEAGAPDPFVVQGMRRSEATEDALAHQTHYVSTEGGS